MTRICPAVLLVWPYLFLPVAYLDSLHPDDPMIYLIAYCVLTPIVLLLNIICAIRNKDVRSLSRWNMILKLCHIPFFAFVFFYGIAVVLFTWAFLFFTHVILAVLFIIDILLIITTSSYGISALIRSKANGSIRTSYLVTHLVLHFIFVLDVFSSISLFSRIRKMQKNA